MEKYGTYKVYKHKTTGEILRVIVDSEDFTKIANDLSNWKELESDPDIESVSDSDKS